MIKRVFDIVLAVILIILLAKIVSRGPAMFWTDRVGLNNGIFKMAKFRTMKLDTPQVATHLMKSPKQYLIPGAEFLRKYSLDELPQLLMS